MVLDAPHAPPPGLLDLPIERTGRWNVSLRAPGIRPYPFPFAAALAISNENAFATANLFEDVHAFVSGLGPTPWGDGLGLEVGDSLALTQGGALATAMGGSAAERVTELIAAGWLDQIYCADHCRVDPAALDDLGGNRPSVWIGPVSPASFHALARGGVRYVGDDDWLEIEKFGDYLDFKTADRFRLAARRYDWERLRSKFLKGSPSRDLVGFVGAMNKTLQPAEGSGGRRFKRYRGRSLPSMPGFSGQITSAALDQLVSRWGVVIVQQQLGRWALIGAAEGREQARPTLSPALDLHAVAAWREIAERNASGQLWVASVSRLLDYLSIRDALAFRVDMAPERWIITIEGVRTRDGALRPSSRAEIDGLAFTIPEGAPEVVVTQALARQPLPARRNADPALRSRDSVYLPWVPLEWPKRARAGAVSDSSP